MWIRIDSIRIRIRIQKFSSIRIRIRIHNVIESGSIPDPDTDPDTQQYFKRQIFSKIKTSTTKKVKDIQFVLFLYLSVIKINKINLKSTYFSSFSCPRIRDPDSQCGSGSTKSLNPDPQPWI
jgi:hypothetical protein